MQKIVIERYGCFRLSDKALYWLAEKNQSMAVDWLEFIKNEISLMQSVEHFVFQDNHLHMIDRADPLLVECVETLRGEADGMLDGEPVCLEIIEIPDDIEWTVENDGFCEWVAEKHRRWYAEKH